MHRFVVIALLAACTQPSRAPHPVSNGQPRTPNHQVTESAAAREAREIIAGEPSACTPPNPEPITIPIEDAAWVDRYVIVGDRCHRTTRADPGPCSVIHPCFTWSSAATCEAAIPLCKQRSS